MVEEGEQAPVNQPGSVLKLVKRVVVQLEICQRASPILSNICDHYLLFD